MSLTFYERTIYGFAQGIERDFGWREVRGGNSLQVMIYIFGSTVSIFLSETLIFLFCVV